MEQPRLTRCRRCGEMKGQALVDDPWEGLIYRPVRCICSGIGCRVCRRRMIRRPISNNYHEPTGTVWHTPYFAYLTPCRTCRDRE